ncbi:Ig-like domain-containing protein, partial [Flaviramulus aquimarinus]|uniref:Ig-like domain-containing protein n=1 Tax=Flaviramulus aquimarinus TaxID=1170456 RepID=UPI0031E50CB6
MRNKYNCISVVNITKAIFLVFFIVFSSLLTAQQSPSIQTGVTFQWSDTQPNLSDPATIESITINSTVYNTFVVPSDYEMTRLGPSGHSPNRLIENGVTTASASNVSNWNTLALSAFQDKNLNHYFYANPNGQNICNDFNAIATTNAQKQTIFYNPAIPSNSDGVLAVTERGGNNCFYIEIWGIPAGGGVEQKLGETFIRNSGNYTGCNFTSPNSGSDYWHSGRCNQNGQTIAIGLFYLNDIAPTGSKISKIEFVGATSDHGDGKFFLLQKYAVDQQELNCIDTGYSGDLDLVNNVPDNSTYSLISGPTPAGQSFNLNTDGTYTYVPSAGYTGDVVFDYEVCLPAPNTSVCDQATVTLSFVDLPPEPTINIDCDPNSDNFIISVTSPLDAEYEYSLNNGTYQSSPDFTNLPEGSYSLSIRSMFSQCENDFPMNPIILDNLELTGTATDVSCRTEATGNIDISVSGGKTPYTFSWNNGDTTEDLNNVIAGNYTVTVTDANGCTITQNYTIDQPSQELSSTRTIDDVLCNGDTTGAIYLSVSGGTAPYTFLWNNGSTNQNITGLAAGNYSVLITDANGCTANNSATVTEPDSIPCQIIVDGCPPTIDTACSIDGSGTPFSWLPPQFSYQCCTSSPGDNYSFNVEFDLPESGNTCWDYNRVQRIGNNNLRLFQSSGTDVNFTAPLSYFDTTSGVIINMEIIIPSGIFDWTLEVLDNNTVVFSDTVTGLSSNGLQTITIPSSIPSGAYRLRFSFDDNGTNLNARDKIEVDRIYYNAVLLDTACLDGVNFAVTSNYNPGDLFPDGTTGVTYTATYTYPDGSTDVLTCGFDVTITNISLSEVTADRENVTCNGESDGSFTINATGGNVPYTYSLDNIDFTNTTGTFSNLSANNYIVYVKDDNDCSDTINVTITQPDELELSIESITDVACLGDTNGAIDISISGGTQPYTYAWSNSETSEDLSNLSAATYTVTVTDSNGCTISDSFEVSTVPDNTNPTITCPGDISQGVDAGLCSADIT